MVLVLSDYVIFEFVPIISVWRLLRIPPTQPSLELTFSWIRSTVKSPLCTGEFRLHEMQSKETFQSHLGRSRNTDTYSIPTRSSGSDVQGSGSTFWWHRAFLEEVLYNDITHWRVAWGSSLIMALLSLAGILVTVASPFQRSSFASCRCRDVNFVIGIRRWRSKGGHRDRSIVVSRPRTPRGFVVLISMQLYFSSND